MGNYACHEKTWAKTCFLHQNQIVTILKKRVVKQAISEAKRKSEIIAVSNKYKNTLDNFIDSLDLESLN